MKWDYALLWNSLILNSIGFVFLGIGVNESDGQSDIYMHTVFNTSHVETWNHFAEKYYGV